LDIGKNGTLFVVSACVCSHRVDGLHPREAAYGAMEEGRYTIAIEVLPSMVPLRPTLGEIGDYFYHLV
jgi:hypothetical protein